MVDLAPNGKCFGCEEPFRNEHESFSPYFASDRRYESYYSVPGFFHWWHERRWRGAIVAARILK